MGDANQGLPVEFGLIGHQPDLARLLNDGLGDFDFTRIKIAQGAVWLNA